MFFDNDNGTQKPQNPLAVLEDYEGYLKRKEEADKQAQENFLSSLKAVHEKDMQPSKHAAELLEKLHGNKIEERGLLSEELAEIKKENKKDFLFNLMDKKDSNAA